MTSKFIGEKTYKELYSHKFENWVKMYQFYKSLLPQLTQHKTDHWNSAIITKEVEFVI